MANIIVTGAKGTLGVPLSRALEDAGHKVFRIDLQHGDHPLYIRADIGEYRELLNAFSVVKNTLSMQKGGDIDYVFHLAAEFGRMNGEMYYDKVWKTNAIGTKNILDIQKMGLFDKLIFFSSSEVYGDTKIDGLNEDIMMNTPVIQKNDYAISKWVNEMQIMNHEALYKLPIMRIRLFNAYGPGEYFTPFRSVVCLLCFSALAGRKYSVYEGYHRVFMYVDDLIPTLTNCVGLFKAGSVVNIGGEEYRSVKDLSDIVLKTLGKDDSDVKYLPEDVHNTVNKRPDITLAKEMLKHNPTITLEEGVPKTIEWMKKIYDFK